MPLSFNIGDFPSFLVPKFHFSIFAQNYHDVKLDVNLTICGSLLIKRIMNFQVFIKNNCKLPKKVSNTRGLLRILTSVSHPLFDNSVFSAENFLFLNPLLKICILLGNCQHYFSYTQKRKKLLSYEKHFPLKTYNK